MAVTGVFGSGVGVCFGNACGVAVTGVFGSGVGVCFGNACGVAVTGVFGSGVGVCFGNACGVAVTGVFGFGGGVGVCFGSTDGVPPVTAVVGAPCKDEATLAETFSDRFFTSLSSCSGSTGCLTCGSICATGFSRSVIRSWTGAWP